MKGLKRICKYCGEPFDCMNRNCFKKAGCQVTHKFNQRQVCSCSNCLMVIYLRLKLPKDRWDHELADVFLRCWDLKGKELEELKRISRMVA